MVIDALLDAAIDSLKLIPFLFLTYLLMEYLEHKAGKKTEMLVKRSGKWGPFLGGVLGVVPQCGFSAAGSNLYAGRVITMGTLIAIYLSTSDEMLPILISEKADPALIFKILGLKALIGVACGFITDVFISRFVERSTHMAPATRDTHIVEICEQEHCNCSDENIFKSAVKHTLQVLIFIFLISLVINVLIGFVGEDNFGSFLAGNNVLGVLLSGLVGLVPNCAASVVITQLYLEGLLGFGAMMSGLLVGAGVGLLVLFRINESLKENLAITGLLYAFGVCAGFALSLFFG